MQNKILSKRAALEASLFTLDYQIEKLTPFFSKLQVGVWIAQRDEVLSLLGKLPTTDQIKENAKRTTASVKDLRVTILKNRF